MRNYSLLLSKKFYFRNVVIFLAFFVVFFLSHNLVEYENLGILLFSNILLLITFIITVINSKLGFYFFIFFIPLLNNLTIILGIRSIDFPLFLFFAFFLGFICSYLDGIFLERLGFLERRRGIDREIIVIIFTFTLILLISSFITAFRYSNFFPFITNEYHNLKVSIDKFDSNSAILWTIKFFFNYVLGFLLLFAIFNIFERIKDILISIIVFFASTFLSSLMVFFQYFVNPYVGSFKYWVETGRLNATFTDPNSLGAFTMLMFPLFISTIIYFKKWFLKLIFSLLTLILLIMVILSGSRSALLGVVIAAFVFVIIGLVLGAKRISQLPKRKKLMSVISFLIILFILVSALLLIFLTENKIKNNIIEIGLIQRTITTVKTFMSYFKSAGFIESLKSISNYRYIFWRMALNMARDYPFTGV
ncbi:MAG: hypothetical protein FJW56_01525, partial [Actinobacteria bacterium]|nr:hypothetical protein [Actinomycetota bacterium]